MSTDPPQGPRANFDRAKLEAVLEAAVDAIITIDVRGIILSCNSAAERMFGFATEELIGSNVSILMPPPDRERHDEYITRFLETREPRVIGMRREATARRKNGEVFPIELSVSQSRVDDSVWFTGIIHDISGRKAAERAEAQRKAIEAKSAARTELLRHMSHEIRTPLTAIIGFAEMAVARVEDPVVVEAIEIVLRNGEHLLHLINDILDLERLEADRIEPEQIAVDLRRILDEVIAVMRPLAERKGLHCDAHVDRSVPTTILSDPTRIRQILLNLIGNAVKFTRTGRIRIDARRCAEPHASLVAVSVIDTGIGIAAEQRARLFEPFVQADCATTREFGGSGLGLAISRRLARVLGGDVTVRANEADGRGSVFTATLEATTVGPEEPCHSVAAEPHPPRRESRRALSEREILLAEDGPDIQLLVRRLLENAGAIVTVTANGQDAVSRVVARGPSVPFDLILMDMQMPGMDGWEATRAIRALGYDGPIVALTANATQADRDRSLSAGCDEFATKPIRKDELVSLIARLVAQEP